MVHRSGTVQSYCSVVNRAQNDSCRGICTHAERQQGNSGSTRLHGVIVLEGQGFDIASACVARLDLAVPLDGLEDPAHRQL